MSRGSVAELSQRRVGTLWGAGRWGPAEAGGASPSGRDVAPGPTPTRVSILRRESSEGPVYLKLPDFSMESGGDQFLETNTQVPRDPA